MTPLGAALAAAFAVWLWFPGGRTGLGRLAPGGGRVRSHARPDARALAAAGLAVAVVAASGVVGGAPAGVVALVVCLVVGTGALLALRQQARRVRAARRAEVVRAGDLIAGLLRVGRVPSAALLEAAEDAPVLAVAAAELRVGGAAGAALRRHARVPGQEGLADLGGAWDVAERTGASLCDAVDAAATALAAEAEVARVVAAELAATRTAGRIMAGLPACGLLLGYVVGSDPLRFLLGHPLGWACLVAGALLACSGVLWIDLVAERSGGR